MATRGIENEATAAVMIPNEGDDDNNNNNNSNAADAKQTADNMLILKDTVLKKLGSKNVNHSGLSNDALRYFHAEVTEDVMTADVPEEVRKNTITGWFFFEDDVSDETMIDDPIPEQQNKYIKVEYALQRMNKKTNADTIRFVVDDKDLPHCIHGMFRSENLTKYVCVDPSAADARAAVTIPFQRFFSKLVNVSQEKVRDILKKSKEYGYEYTKVANKIWNSAKNSASPIDEMLLMFKQLEPLKVESADDVDKFKHLVSEMQRVFAEIPTELFSGGANGLETLQSQLGLATVSSNEELEEARVEIGHMEQLLVQAQTESSTLQGRVNELQGRVNELEAETEAAHNRAGRWRQLVESFIFGPDF